MWSRISVATALLLAASTAARAAPPDLWPLEIPPLGAGALEQEIKRIDNEARSLPPELAPAVSFQKAFLRAMANEPSSRWQETIQRLATSPGDQPVIAAVREVARIWLARLRMEEIDQVLRAYYQKEVRFPETLAAIEQSFPEELRTDPWNEPWVYEPKAPREFARLAGQRYQLGPSRFPNLQPLKAATKPRKPAPRRWQIRGSPDGRALEFRSGDTAAVLQPGGRIEDCTLVFIGDRWALMAASDQLFTVQF